MDVGASVCLPRRSVSVTASDSVDLPASRGTWASIVRSASGFTSPLGALSTACVVSSGGVNAKVDAVFTVLSDVDADDGECAAYLVSRSVLSR